MRPLRVSLWCCALAALAVGNGSAAAAWNNVFQVCCHSCRSSNYVAAPAPAVAAYAAPAPACGGCQQCTTNYVQRSYYQPVVTYQQSCYQEPVTTYRTSYYYEPCTSVRYSCYYDPCSCSYQQVAQPVTTYRLRSQCCPVTSYLQRCCLKPVTTYQQMTYYEPQTTCCQTTIGAPVAAPPAGAGVAVPQQPMVQSGPLQPQQQPMVQGGPLPQQPAASGAPIGAGPAAVGSPNEPPAASGGPLPPGQAGQTSNSNRSPWWSPARQNAASPQPQLQAPIPTQSTTPARTPPLRYDRVTSMPRANAEGQVLRGDRQPQARMRVVFVCADEQTGRQTVTTDAAGRFQTTLNAGNWLVYTQDAAGRLTYQQKMRVEKDKPTIPITLVSR